jgi:formylglycine-generating enzyme required for sulfatase activity/tRNA A-37 threonylcarbamoyl transferase component Bud32
VPVAHPSPEQLSAFGLGRGTSAERAEIECHVAACSECWGLLESIPPDSFVDLVAGVARDVTQARPSSADTVEKAGPLAGTDPSSPSPRRADATPLPDALCHHARYRVTAALGSGGMGAVFKAEHRLMERTVALKVINQKLLDHPQAVERFRREVKAAARLSHPNIVAAFDAEQVGDTHFLVMEYVEGTSLAQVVEQEGPLPVALACDYIRQAALGLQHAHEQGMAHRDLKPHNLMVTPNGLVKILDFGLARLATETAKGPALTQDNVVMGTPDYIAPEQATDARRADIRADIYSLGCTLYHLLSGHPPFPEGTALNKIMAHLEQKPPRLGTIRADMPAELEAVMGKMMAKDPARRYQAPAQVAQALVPFLKFPAMAGAAPSRIRRLPRRAWVAAILAAALVGWLAWSVLRIDTGEGTLVVETDDPDVEVVVKQGGKQVTIIDPKTRREVDLKAGKYELELRKGKDGLKLQTKQFTLRRGDKEIVRVRFEPKAGAGPDPTPAPGPKFEPLPDKDYVTNSIGMVFVQVPAGVFVMGSPKDDTARGDDETQHEVEITKPFYLGVFTVTQQQYEAVMKTNPSRFQKVQGQDTRRFPVENVSWNDAQAFCRRLGELALEKKAGRTYQMPTEAQWEYACRGRTKVYSIFHYGNTLTSDLANFHGRYPYPPAAKKGIHLGRPTSVGSYKPNAFGLYDMHGNVWQWCIDWYGPYKAQKDPKGPDNGERRVVRGGGWDNEGAVCRAAQRNKDVPGARDHGLGFRVVCVLP